MKEQDYRKDLNYINAKFLNTSIKAQNKTLSIILVDIFQKVSHIVPIHFVGADDTGYVPEDACGAFTSIRVPYSNKRKALYIGILLDDEKIILDRIITLLHEVGHFVYMNYGLNEAKNTLNDNSPSSYNEDLANLFVVDYIDSLPLWMQASLKSWREVYSEPLIEKGFKIDTIEFDGEEVYNDLEKNGLLYLLNKESI